MYVGEETQINDVEVIKPFADAKLEIEEKKSLYNKEDYENAKKGDIKINWIHVTNKFEDTVSRISHYSENPFIPKGIKDELENLITEINQNISTVLKGELQEMIHDMISNKNGEGVNFNPIGFYNNFNHSRIHHSKRIEKLRNEIRVYLKIDDMPM